MRRKLAGRSIFPIGFGAMNVSHCYQPALPDQEGAAVLHAALDAGHDHLDTAAVYGHGHNEKLIGEHLAHRRDAFVLASKCGIVKDPETGKRGINSRPDLIRRSVEESLANLRTDRIDLYYCHRWDKVVPIEEVAGTLGRLVEEGKVLAIGFSEIGAETLRRAHAEHPVAAVQSEYSLWTRNPEIAVLDACEEIGAAFVAFSPLARQFLTGRLRGVDHLTEGDIRLTMPRFEPEAYARNLALLDEHEAIAKDVGCSPAQLALAWLLHKGEHVVPIPGTQSIEHLKENVEAAQVTLSPGQMERLDALFPPGAAEGGRYNPAIQQQIDTEEFEAEAA